MGDRTGSPNLGYLYEHRAHPHGAHLIHAALPRATRLVSIVRDEDASAVARILDGLTYEQTAAVIVVLASMVPDDQSVADLTAWVTNPPAPDYERRVGA